MQTKHIKSLAREVAHILILFENWHAASKRLQTPDLVNLLSSKIFVCQLRNLLVVFFFFFFPRDIALAFFDLYI